MRHNAAMADTPFPPAELPGAGWYPDPAGSDGTRWWDGKGWTDHVRPGSTGTGPATPTAPSSPTTAPDVPTWAQGSGSSNQTWWQDAGPTPEPFTMPVGATPRYAKPPTADGAVRSLVLGILAILCCGILGPFAIYAGNQARFRIRVSNGRLGGDGIAIAGMILGAIATVLLVIGLLLLATGPYRATTYGS